MAESLTEPQTVALALLLTEPTDRALAGWMPLPSHVGSNEFTAARWLHVYLTSGPAVIG